MRPTQPGRSKLLGGPAAAAQREVLEAPGRGGRDALAHRPAPAGRVTRGGPRPGSLSIPIGSWFGTWLGWVVDPDRPLVLILLLPRTLGRCRPPGAPDRLRGEWSAIFGGGFLAWAAAGAPTDAGGRLRSTSSPKLDGGPDRYTLPDRRRQASEYRVRSPPGRCMARRASCRTASTSFRGTARSRRSARPDTGRAWPHRCCGRPVSGCQLGGRRGTGLGEAGPSGRSGGWRWLASPTPQSPRSRNRIPRRPAIATGRSSGRANRPRKRGHGGVEASCNL